MPKPQHPVLVGEMVIAERFHQRYVAEALTGCWLWDGQLVNGYGKFWNGMHSLYAHRYSFVLHRGAIPDGMVVDHKCNNPSCVNPDHLQAISQRANLMRSTSAKAKLNSSKDNCPQCGGAYHFTKCGSRSCRRCRARAMRILRARWKQNV